MLNVWLCSAAVPANVKYAGVPVKVAVTLPAGVTDLPFTVPSGVYLVRIVAAVPLNVWLWD